MEEEEPCTGHAHPLARDLFFRFAINNKIKPFHLLCVRVDRLRGRPGSISRRPHRS